MYWSVDYHLRWGNHADNGSSRYKHQQHEVPRMLFCENAGIAVSPPPWAGTCTVHTEPDKRILLCASLLVSLQNPYDHLTFDISQQVAPMANGLTGWPIVSPQSYNLLAKLHPSSPLQRICSLPVTNCQPFCTQTKILMMPTCLLAKIFDDRALPIEKNPVTDDGEKAVSQYAR